MNGRERGLAGKGGLTLTQRRKLSAISVGRPESYPLHVSGWQLIELGLVHINGLGERPSIVASLVEYKEKDGIEAKLKFSGKAEVVVALHEACGREVLLVTNGADEFMEEAGPAQIDADEPRMPGMGDEYNDQ